MHIPERLEQKLKADRSLRSSVEAAVADFVPWLEDSKLPFFPDYTDHGTKHVEGILVTASSLIGDEAWEAVTAEDVGVLILSALLHDCAMHITEDGFHALVSGRTHTARIPGFGDADWPALWQEYLFSAKRFDDRALTDLFGEPLPVRTPPSNPNQMTRADRLLIGEFVRRHHPRLAHEIALRGVPGPDDRPIKLPERLDAKLADLAGLVARSHGLPLRATFDYLKKFYHRREYKRVHAVFLMAVLRIADYLQIQAERAPRQMLQVKQIRSPFSRREWAAHLSVDNIVPYEDDPEAILIQATPPDVHTFLRLKGWLSGIQEELDTSWAVLGEIYGPAEKLRPLGLVIRRIRSNLDDTRSFGELVPYVPRRVEFDIARSEILKLLVRPLYGDRPEIGVRELLQNAVDAVRELWDLQEQNPLYGTADLIDQEADVVMWLDEPDETGRATFTISDRGVGMTEEVITDYFLKVGASYRNSDAWAKQHEDTSAEHDDEPSLKSRVLRSGRFGIGALAAFLLGDEIEVTTRHVTADKGIRFTTRLESEAIELRHDESVKVGTTVRTPLTQDTFERLTNWRGEGPSQLSREDYEDYIKQRRWDWYCLGQPSVIRLFGRAREVLTQRLDLPNPEDGLTNKWYEVSDSEYRAIHCTHLHHPALVCNGIEIRDANNDSFDVTGNFFDERAWVSVDSPLVSVSDPDGSLPLNLMRSDLILGDFVDEIYDSKMEYALAYMIFNAPERHHPGWPKPDFLRVHGSLGGDAVRRWPWAYTESGLTIFTPWNARRQRLRCCVTLLTYDWGEPMFDLPRGSHDATILVNLSSTKNRASSERRHREAAAGLVRVVNKAQAFYNIEPLPVKGSRLLVTSEFGSRAIMQSGKWELTNLYKEWENERWMLLATPNTPPTRFDLHRLETFPVPKWPAGKFPMAAEWFLSDWGKGDEPEGLAYFWDEIIREPVIPYDQRERRTKLAYAYEVLAPYLERLESDAQAEAATRGAQRRGGRLKRKSNF